jgi:TRAP-type C4-dicarboxylate transport system substrate-binding protein
MIRIRSAKKVTAVKVVLAVIGLFLFSVGWTYPGEAASPIQMKFATHLGPSHPITPIFQEWLKELSEASNGTVAIDYHGAESMGKAIEYWDMVTEGLADMAGFACAYNPARFQMSAFVELPFFSTSSKTSYDVAQALLAKNLITSEFEPNRLLVQIMSPPAQIFSNKNITKIEDFKGTRFFGLGPVWTKTLGLLGAQSVSMNMMDVYLALERGTLDAAANNWASVMSYRWVEVAKYPIEINFMGGWFNGIIMNKKSWSKLSPEVQAAWTKICEKYGPRYAAVFDNVESAAKKVWMDAGKKIEAFPAAEKEKLGVILAPVWEDWIDRMEKAGKPGKEIYKTYVEVMKNKGEPVVMKVPGLYRD